MTYILTKGLDSSLDLSRPAVAMKHKTILPDLIVTIAIGYFTHTTHTQKYTCRNSQHTKHTQVFPMKRILATKSIKAIKEGSLFQFNFIK